MRSKARFLNIFPLVNWMEKIRAHWDELLAFLQTHYELIDELICLKEGPKPHRGANKGGGVY